MPPKSKQPTNTEQTSRLITLFRTYRLGLGVFGGLLLLLWVALPLVPEESGLRFGTGYQFFFTVIVFFGMAFFWLLGRERLPCPTSSLGVIASLSMVFTITIGTLVTIGMLYPQFEIPQPVESVASGPVERGEELFWNEAGMAGCFRCHTIDGRGGTRGPNLSRVASRAQERVSGLAAEQYLTEKIGAGSSYQFVVPEYPPMMLTFRAILTEENIEDIVAYLLSLD